LVLILGGGVSGDMGAFAASTYMRGVPFVQVPTTLLAQVDSSIGGKTGFDYLGLKNLIGTFAQPVAVLIDTDTLKTLPRRQLVAGFGEMFKHGLVSDREYFEQLISKRPEEFSMTELAGFIAKSVRIKAAIVQKDEKEAGARKLVNFGHTVGHAVEELSWKTDRPLLHGEAVGIGMVVETELSWRQGHLAGADVERVTAAIKASGLPVAIPDLPLDDLIAKMHSDKKDIGGVIEFDLLDGIGKARFNQTVDEQVVREALEHNMESAHAV
jgi:3-dehydroquinate synthase